MRRPIDPRLRLLIKILQEYITRNYLNNFYKNDIFIKILLIILSDLLHVNQLFSVYCDIYIQY